MSVQITCSGCGRVLSAKNEYAGRRIRCPKCYTTNHLPGETDMPSFQEVETGQWIVPPVDYGYNLPPHVIDPTKWHHVCRCVDLKPRPIPWTVNTWTAAARYDIFERTDSNGRVVALRWCGSNYLPLHGWFLSADRADYGETNLLDMIAAMPDEGRRWDACHFLCQAVQSSAHRAARDADSDLRKAIAEGRITIPKEAGR